MARLDQGVVLEAARQAYKAGLTILPTRSDGSKRPAVSTWAEFKDRRPTPEECRAMHFDQAEGLGIVAGGGVECWDFDDHDIYQRFVEAASAEGLADVVDRIRAGYEDATPRGGRRWIVRLPVGVAWKDETLAGRPNDKDVEVLIELPTFAVVAPSNGRTHPSGKPYVRLSGGFDTLTMLTAEERDLLIVIARRFDERPRRQQAPRAAHSAVVDGHRPGDDFNRRATWAEVLQPHGWQECGTRGETTLWTRPGKDRGVSATTNHAGSDLLYIFSSSTSFEADRSYDKFAAHAMLEHGGDFGQAARALAQRGYGEQLARAVAQTRPGSLLKSTPARTDVIERTAPPEMRPVLVRMADVQPEPVRWIWFGHIAIGKLALLVGDPKLGKSWITLDAAARVSSGRPWPDGAPATEAGDVILLSAEDGVADTIRPRLDALGADVSRIHHLAVLRAGESERAIQLSDTTALEQAIRQTNAKLLTIDPMSAYLGSTDSHRDAEVRGLMAPLAGLAERTGVAILGVMHLAKSAQRPAIYRAIGSIAFTAAARIVQAVAADPEHDDRRILASIGCNLAASPVALAYTLAEGRLCWEADPVAGVDVETLLAGPTADREERREADAWLRQMLADGPVESRQIQRNAEQAGLSRRTLFRAKARLGVEAERIGGVGGGGKWYWRLPVPKSATNSATEEEMALLAHNPKKPSEFTGFAPKSATSNRLALLERGTERLTPLDSRPCADTTLDSSGNCATDATRTDPPTNTDEVLDL